MLLLDTHVVLWWRAAPDRIAPKIREAIATSEVVLVSAASAWEVAIKEKLGKLTLPEPFSAGVAASGFSTLDITFEHAEAIAALPLHHADPFDRMLIAQAACERLELVTNDRAFAAYQVPILWG